MAYAFAHITYNWESGRATLKVFDGPTRLAEIEIGPEALALLVADGARILTTVIQQRNERKGHAVQSEME